MKKALKFLGVAAVAALLLAGCKTGTQDISGDVTVTYPTGTLNHDFNGKTLVNTATTYITKRVTVNNTVTLASSVTETQIPYQTVTTTLTFASDTAKTFTETVVTTYLAGADGDYRTLTSVPSGTNLTTTTTYLLAGFAVDEYLNGYAGVTTSSITSTGTWRSVVELDGVNDSQTLDFYVTLTSKVETTASIGGGTSTTVTAPTGTTDTNLWTYKVTSNQSTTSSLTGKSAFVNYSPRGTVTVGTAEKNVFVIYVSSTDLSINSVNFIEQ